MSPRTSTFLTRLFGVAVLVGLVGAVPLPVTIRAHFSDNSINTNFWTIRSLGGVSMAETNEHLEFSAAGSTGSLSFAGLEVKNWGARWRYDFEVDLDYKLGAVALSNDRQITTGIW